MLPPSIAGRFRTGWLALILTSALVGALTGGAGSALAGDSRADALDAARELVSRSGLDCIVVGAGAVQPETPAGSGRRRGGGGMGGGGMGHAGMSAGDEPEGGSRNRSAPLGYEVTCQDRIGFVLLDAAGRHGGGRGKRGSDGQEDAGAAPAAGDYLNCLEADAAADKLGPAFRCRLKGNRDRIAPIQALVSHAGLDCSVSRVRGLGHTETRAFFELACAKGPAQSPPKVSDTGVVLVTSRKLTVGGELAALSCFDTQANPSLKCSLTNVGAIVETLHRSIARAHPDCIAVSQRLVGLSQTGGRVFEIACRNGAGYMARLSDDGSMDPPVSCSDPVLGGGCRLANAPKPKAAC